MSQELINAAAVGDIQTVTRLLNAGADVNFIGKTLTSIVLPATARLYSGPINATSAAILCKQWDVLRILLSHSVHFMTEDKSTYSPGEDYIKNPYLCALFACEWNKDIFISILAKTPSLNGSIDDKMGNHFKSVVGYFLHLKLLSSLNRISAISQILERINLIYHEAIIRADRAVIDAVLTERTECIFNEKTFAGYLQMRGSLTPDHAESTQLGLNFLLEKKAITDVQHRELLKTAAKYTRFEISIAVFPVAIREHIAKRSTRSLSELYCEYLSLINPSFPLYHVDSPLGKKMEYSIPRDALRGLQDVIFLRETLAKLDTTALLVKLCKAATDLKEDSNPAALLLAEILLYHANDKILVNNKEETFLSTELVRTGVLLLNRLYKLNPTEQLHLATVRDMQITLEEQGKELQETRQELKDIKAQLQESNALIKQLIAGMKQGSTHGAAQDKEPISNSARLF